MQEIGDMDLDNTQPRLTCVEADVTNVKKEDTVTINGILYDVTNKPQTLGADWKASGYLASGQY